MQTIFVSGFHCKNRHLDYKEQPFSSGHIEFVWGLENDSTFWFHGFPDFSGVSHLCVRVPLPKRPPLLHLPSIANNGFVLGCHLSATHKPENKSHLPPGCRLTEQCIYCCTAEKEDWTWGKQAVLYGLIHECSASSSLFKCWVIKCWEVWIPGITLTIWCTSQSLRIVL